MTLTEQTFSGTAVDALAAIGISPEEAIEADNESKKRGPRDQRICICGHGMSKHKEYGGRIVCKPSTIYCLCKQNRPVLEVEDTRMFLRKTQGGGALHALSRGMSALIIAGKNAKWIVELRCDKCGSVDSIVTPVPVSETGQVRTDDTGYYGLLCQSCREGN